MAKGKYGNRAASRRESQEVQSEIATYQRNVKRLTADNVELRKSLAKERTSHVDDVKNLKAQLAEGLTPELIVLRKKVEEQSERASTAERRYSDLSRKWQIATNRLVHALTSTFGITGAEAVEFGVNTIFREEEDGEKAIVVATNSTDHKGAARLGAEGIARIAAARGERRKGVESVGAPRGKRVLPKSEAAGKIYGEQS